MVKYIPVRFSTSMSVKEEQVFESTEELVLHLCDYFNRVLRFVDSARSVSTADIVIGASSGPDPVIGWSEMHTVSVLNRNVGFCGE